MTMLVTSDTLDSDRPRSPSCLVLHGLGGGRYELEPLIAALETDGLSISTPVLPGHEGPGPIMPASCWRDWSATAESGYDELTKGGGPIVVVGFSTGATLALYLASRRPIAALVLLAPFMAIRYSGLIPLPPASYLGLLSRIKPDLPRRGPAVRDPKMRALAESSNAFRTFNVKAALSALELIEEVKLLIPRLTVPTLILQGALDSVVEPGGASTLYQNLGSAQKSLITLPNSDHLLALDRDRTRVIELVREFCGNAGGI